MSSIWYQVDEGDADIASFFYYMGLAAKKSFSGGRAALPLLSPEYLMRLETFTLRYFEKLYGMVKPPFVMVFDNYQEVSSESPVHQCINVALSMLPEGCHGAVISRNDPHPAFARLRANAAMCLMGWEQLRFTIEETKEVLRLGGQSRLSREELVQLHRKTYGWAAGLVLFLEKARTGGPISETLEKVTREGIFDYFAEEVIKKADEEIREFLMKTAFLPQVRPLMAAQLTGSGRSKAILSRLRHDHFFTTKQASQEAVYQYHPLFREFLLGRAEEHYTKEERGRIQEAAAALLESSGQLAEAADLLMASGRWEKLSLMVRTHALLLMGQGRSEVIRKWLEALPEDIVETDPHLLYWKGVCVMAFSPRESRLNLEKAFALFKKQDDMLGMLLSWSGAADTSLHESEFSHLDRWIAVLEGLMAKEFVFPSRELEAASP